MRIIYFTSKLSEGGAERQLILTAKKAFLNGYTPIIVTIYDNVTYCELLKKSGIKYISLNKKLGKIYNLFVIYDFYKLIKKTNPSIIHSFLAFPSFIAICSNLLLIKYKKIKIISSFRSGLPKDTTLLNDIYIYILVKFIFKFSSGIHFNSLFNLRSFKNKFGSHNNLFFSPNIIDFAKNKDEYHEINSSTNIFLDDCVNKYILLYPSRFIESKGQLKFLEWINELELSIKQKFFIIFVGAISDANYYNKVKNFKVGIGIKVLSFVEEIDLYYQKSNAVIQLSEWAEGSSNVISEAIQMRIPVICSKASDLDLVVQNSESGFYVNEKVELINLLTNFEELFLNKNFKFNLSTNNCGTNILDIYKELYFKSKL
jgi:glycosyltransferase involved in cell wall biosynthesis